MRDMVVLEDSTIISLLNDPTYSESIPCFYNKREILKSNESGGCSACAHKRQERRRNAMAQIKSCLAGMSSEKKTQLKSLLDAKKVRVIYVNAGGQVVQLTF
ncbi:hypothetical protein EBZ39_01160 [bacterium]|nr:hypothetical protein [bacterium]